MKANIIEKNYHDLTLLYNPLSQELVCGDKGLSEYWNNPNLNGDSIYQEVIAKTNFLGEAKNQYTQKVQKTVDDWKNAPLEIYQLYLIVNTNCNFSCKYCRQVTNPQENNCKTVMDEETAFETVDKFLKAKTNKRKGIVFYGGEPTLSMKLLLKLIEYIRKNENEEFPIEINMFTNGSIIDLKTAEYFAQNNVFVIISYDGPKDQNDLMRVFPNNKGTSDRVLKSIDIYKKSGCKFGVSVTIGAHNIDELPKTLKYIKSLNPINIGVNLPHDGHENPLRPKEHNFDWLKDVLDILWDYTKDGIYVEHIIRKLNLFVNKKVKVADCPAVGGRVAVLPDKSVGLCEGAIGISDFFYNLSDWNDLSGETKKWKEVMPLFDKRCANCPALGICGGGCPLDGYFEDGELSNFKTVRCEFFKLLMDKILKEMAYISKNNKENSNKKCWVVDSKEREMLWDLLVSNKEKKPLTTSSEFGIIDCQKV